jgi:hypothetical protein
MLPHFFKSVSRKAHGAYLTTLLVNQKNMRNRVFFTRMLSVMLFVNLKEQDKMIFLFTLFYLLVVISCYNCLYATLIHLSSIPFFLNVPPFRMLITSEGSVILIMPPSDSKTIF